jgi:hypothetical protein
LKPTAVQALGVEQETSSNLLPEAPPGLGADWIVQAAPSQRTTSGFFTPEPFSLWPTAVQA